MQEQACLVDSMGYQGNYYDPDTPGRRTSNVAFIAGCWGMFGWIPCAVLAMGSGFWFVFYGIGFVVIILLGQGYTKNALVQDQGTYTEMAADPDLNTQNYELHYERLVRFRRSMYNGEMVFMGPRGGTYTITASGNRSYR